jgi:AcrR family transcriptional regulator
MLLPMTVEPVPLDRRQRRRQETIEEVLDVAVEVMAEQGVAGLSVGEVARRMGIRPPSLYVYFPSKNALYDALFLRGARSILETLRDGGLFAYRDDATLEQILQGAGEVFVRWAIEHPAYTQLLFWRPVPGYTPTDEAYAPAVELVAIGRERFAELQRRGLVRSDVHVDDVQRDWTIVTAGIVSQQLSNGPHESFDSGAFTSRLSSMVAMFARHYAPSSSSAPKRRASHADKR